MGPGSHCSSPNGEGVFRERKRVGGTDMPSTPNGMGTGLLSRTELVRARPTALHEIGWGQKL